MEDFSATHIYYVKATFGIDLFWRKSFIIYFVRRESWFNKFEIAFVHWFHGTFSYKFIESEAGKQPEGLRSSGSSKNWSVAKLFYENSHGSYIKSQTYTHFHNFVSLSIANRTIRSSYTNSHILWVCPILWICPILWVCPMPIDPVRSSNTNSHFLWVCPILWICPMPMSDTSFPKIRLWESDTFLNNCFALNNPSYTPIWTNLDTYFSFINCSWIVQSPQFLIGMFWSINDELLLISILQCCSWKVVMAQVI